MITEELSLTTQFEKDILEGLRSKPKYLSSKYFYDERGDKLFQEIMKLEEYYLTRSEYEIFSLQKEAIIDALTIGEEKLQLIEFGAGDGLKSKLLLKELLQREVNFEYVPIDISAHVLEELESSLFEQMPDLQIRTVVDHYFSALKNLNSEHRKVVLFLGSNIGNFYRHEALEFLAAANRYLNEGDYFLLGVDLKKNPETILAAYNDRRGVTKAFNLNLLHRINSTLNSNFDLDQFEHYPTYDPLSGETKSYLISIKEQKVIIDQSNEVIHFDRNEPIFMEVSKKYSVAELEELSKQAGFSVVKHFYDCRHYFVDTLWKK